MISRRAIRGAGPFRMIDFGFDKIALIGAVALIVIGPERLPRVARTVGHLLGKAQRYVADVKAEVNRSIELDELKKMKSTFEDAARDVEQTIGNEIRETSAELDKSWSEAAVDLRDERRRSDARHAGARVSAPEQELARQARRHAAVVQAAPRRARQGAIGRGARRPLPAVRGRRPEPMSSNDDKPDELAGTEQPFVSHLIELRDRLIRAAIAVALCFGVLAVYPARPRCYDLLAAPLVSHLPQGARR